MKRILLIIIIIFTSLIFFSCSPKNNDLDILDNARYEEEEIKYEIEQILFSKSFQSIEPSVEIITNNNKLKILASLGLSEYSSININSITKKGNQVNINVSGIYNKADLRLAVPQVFIELKKSDLKQVESLKFNIVYEDYSLLKIKYSINDVLNKLQSHLKLSATGTPTFNLIKIKDNIAWDISYNSIFDRESPNTPLINLSAQVDANTGEIINLDKFFISSYIDNGHVLSYVNNDYILYKKSILDKDKATEQLWIYNHKDEEKNMLYSSNFKISSAQVSPNLQYISIIETSDNGSNTYIMPLSDKRAYKIFFEEKFNPRIMRWVNEEILYLVESKDGNSTIYSHNAKNNETDVIVTLNKNIEGLVVKDNSFLISEKIENEFNSKISLTTDWSNFRLIGQGLSPRFADENIISFLQKHTEKDSNSLIIYDINDKSIIGKIEENVSGFDILSNKKIAFVRKNASINNYTLGKYSIEENSSTDITNIIGDKIYYNEDENIIYLNIMLPFDNDKTEMIYSLDLNNLN